jgi:predicted acetyltransferase
MKIVSYDEADHEDVLEMNLHAFGWPMTEQTVKKYLKHDERWLDCVGVYANERGRTIAQVIPLKIRTRTSEGIEIVGGIAGVTVIPDMARRGIATMLMKGAHDIFRENDIRISFLLTAESLVAYGLYEKLGYMDVASFGGAQKFIKTPRKPRGMELRPYLKKDWRIADEIYSRSVRGLLGFVVRQPAFLNMKIDTTPLGRKNVCLADNKRGGYVVRSPAEDYIIIREIMCPAERTFNRIVASVEAEAAQKHIIIYLLISNLLQNRFKKRGYRMNRKTWGRVMVAPLIRGISKRELHRLYDFDGAFFISGLDTF